MTSHATPDAPETSGVAWTVSATLLNGVMHLLLLAFLARILSSQELGLIALTNVIISFALLFSDCGITNYVIYEQNSTPKQQSSLYWFNLCLGCLAAFVVALAAPAFSGLYAAPDLVELLYVAAAIFPIFTLGAQFQAQLSKRLLLTTVAKIEIAGRASVFVSVVVFALLGFGAMSFVVGQLIGAAIRSAAMFLACYSYWKPTLIFDIRVIRAALRFAGFNTAGQLVNRLAADIDVLLIGKFFDVGSLGIYSLAKEFAFGVLRLFTTVVSRVGIPMLAMQQADGEKLTKDYSRLLDVVGFSSGALFSILILAAPWLIPLVYGEQYTGVTLLFSLFALIAILRSLGTVHGVLIVATGRVHLDLGWNILVVCLMVPAIYFAAQTSLENVLVAMLLIQVLLYVAAFPLLVRSIVELSFARFLKPFAIVLSFALLTALLRSAIH
ncbi:MAG: MOP flippase family protein, partial [Woeseiaceae bacterium]